MKTVIYFPPAGSKAEPYPISLPDAVADAMVAGAVAAFPALPPPIASTPAPALTISGVPASATVGIGETFTPVISGGTAPYSLSVASGTLPPGRTISGVTVTGSYTTAGNYSYTLRATDSKGVIADLAVTVTVGAAGVRRLAASGGEDPSSTAAIGSGMFLIQYRTKVNVFADLSDIDFAEALFYVNNTAGQYADVAMPLPAGAVLNAALEVETAVAGTPSVGFVPYTFAGGGSTYTATGSETNWIDSQPVAASAFGLAKFTKGDTLWLRRAILFPSANATWLCNDASDASQPTSGEGVRVAADNTYNKVNGTGAFTGTAGTAPALSRFLRPMAMRGVHSGVAIKLISDSIGHGKDNNRNGDGSVAATPGGPYRRAAHLAALALQKSGRDGNFLSNVTAAKAPVRFAQVAAKIYTHAWVTMGTNDLNNVSAATALSSLDALVTALKNAMPAIKVVADEILARVRDTQFNTDQFTTLAGQTVQGKDSGQQFGPNPTYGTGTDVLSAYRAGLATRVSNGTLAAITTANAGWADSTDQYLIRVNGTAFYWSKDGTHQTLVAAQSTADALAPTLATKFVNP